MAWEGGPQTDPGEKAKPKARLERPQARCRAKSRVQTLDACSEVRSPAECDSLCTQTNEYYAKKKQLRYRERSHSERILYYRALRELISRYGSGSLIYVDEAGFEQAQTCLYAWAKRGKKVYGERTGKRGIRENLVAGRRKGNKDLLAPMIFTGSLDAIGFEGWFNSFFLPSLTQPSVVILDNAPIHRKSKIKTAVKEAEHEVLFLPKYSPDLNDIEHDFSALKRARMYAEADTSLDEIIRNYCAA